MLSYCHSAALFGITAYPVDIEFDIGSGLPAIIIVGLPDTAIKESKDRVRSAIQNSGFNFPERRITINLAPADLKKEGPIYDLPLALGILAADNHVPEARLRSFTVLGELSLDGRIRPIKGVLPMAIALFEQGLQRMIVPTENAQEAAAVQGLEVFPVSSLNECLAFLNGEHSISPCPCDSESLLLDSERQNELDFADVQGQKHAKRGIEVAVAGGHNILLLGPPGSGKTMLARRIASIIPRLSLQESLETSQIHSITQGLAREEHGLVTQRPFRSPHHTISHAGLIGGGSDLRPGEVSMSHNGILFLDEFPEFRRDALEVLREPMEERIVTITRAAGTVSYPANFMLVASMNPCPCGFLTDPRKDCRCSPKSIHRYRSKISGPLLDRIDIHLEVPALSYDELKTKTSGESSHTLRQRIEQARLIQQNRFAGEPLFTNADMSHRHVQKYCVPDTAGENLLKAAFTNLNLSARAHDRILKVARTLADLTSSEAICATHIAEAIGFRALDRDISY